MGRMMNDPIQLMFDIAVAIAGFLAGFLINAMWRIMAKQREDHDHLREELANARIVMAGEYVRRVEFEKHMDGIYALLRRIEDKIDGKADRP
jgi:hypothetical protein